MLVDAGSQMRGHADIHRAPIAVGHDVDPAAVSFAIHREAIEEAGPRVKPGETTKTTAYATSYIVVPGLTRDPASQSGEQVDQALPIGVPRSAQTRFRAR